MSTILDKLPATAGRADIAALFGVSVRTIDTLQQRGVLIPAAQAGTYQVMPSLQAYLGDLRNKAAGRSGDGELTAERTRMAKMNRQIAELNLARVKGEVLTQQEVSDGWTAILRVVKSGVLGIPSKLRFAIPHIGAHGQEVAMQLARDVLTDMAEEIQTMGTVGTHVGEADVGEHPEHT